MAGGGRVLLRGRSVWGPHLVASVHGECNDDGAEEKWTFCLVIRSNFRDPDSCS
jgi:hypothetical protein